MEHYPYPIIKENVKGKDISILGVLHTPKFYEKYKNFLEEVISQNDSVIIEDTAGRDFWQEPSFFGKIADICYNQRKVVYQVDPPQNNITFIADNLLASFGVMAIYYGIKKKSKTKLSRREFLGRIGLIGVGAPMLVRSRSFLGIVSTIDEDILYDGGGYTYLTYNNIDYRNIKIAEGIEKICNKINDIKSITSIHGAGHSKGIEIYLKSILKNKKFLYFPFKIITDTKIREYIPHEEGWILARKF